MAPTKPAVSGTDLIHGDSAFAGKEVGAPISVTTTFRVPLPGSDSKTSIADFDLRNPSRHVYSRYTQDVSTRVEHILSKINNGYALTYASGIASVYAALLFFRPKRIAITGGYHGCHVSIELYNETLGGTLKVVDLDDAYEEGDLCWLETPLNPTGESRDIQYYADKVHAVGGKLFVDATFGPPPLQYPFNHGADVIMHSATKYFGGHSDLLSGVLIVKTLEEWNKLMHHRTYTGSMMGSLESWLLLRSLRTFHLRVPRQSESATTLAQWLNAGVGAEGHDGIPGGIITKVWHSSLQGKDSRGFEPSSQMTGGYNATFGVLLSTPELARELPHALQYFVPATSLGGVESLVEQRLVSDPSADPRLVRISVGVEEVEDLKSDLRKAFQTISKVGAKL